MLFSFNKVEHIVFKNIMLQIVSNFYYLQITNNHYLLLIAHMFYDYVLLSFKN